MMTLSLTYVVQPEHRTPPAADEDNASLRAYSRRDRQTERQTERRIDRRTGARCQNGQ